MPGRPTLIERAYEIASSGSCDRISDIQKRLNREGYEGGQQQLQGPALLASLRRLIAGARVGKAPAEPVE